MQMSETSIFISVKIDLYYDTKQITISVKPKGFC